MEPARHDDQQHRRRNRDSARTVHFRLRRSKISTAPHNAMPA